MLKSSEYHVRFREEAMCEQSNHLLVKDASSSWFQEHVLVLYQKLTIVPAGVKRLTGHHTADKYLLDGDRTALTLYKTASRQGAAVHTKDRKKKSADKRLIRTSSRKFCADMQAKFVRKQTSFDGQIIFAKAVDSERVRILISEKSFRRQLQLRSEDCQEVGELKHRLDGVVAEERRSQTSIVFLREQLLSTRSDFDRYRPPYVFIMGRLRWISPTVLVALCIVLRWR